MKHILKVLVGSRAHGLHNSDSDFDYRGVFLLPTEEFFKIDHKPKITTWIEGGTEDDVAWELEHFLSLAFKGHPNIMDVFMAPQELITSEGKELVEMLPYVLDRNATMITFMNYVENTRKKFLENKDGKGGWFACTMLRTLYNAKQLVRTGRYTINLSKTEIRPICLNWKLGNYTRHEVIQLTDLWEEEVRSWWKKFKKTGKETQDKQKVQDWLFEIRKKNWS